MRSRRAMLTTLARLLFTTAGSATAWACQWPGGAPPDRIPPTRAPSLAPKAATPAIPTSASLPSPTRPPPPLLTKTSTPLPTALSGVTVSATRSATPGNTTTIAWQGNTWHLHGINLPWHSWQRDFGGGVQNGGVSATHYMIGPRLMEASQHGVCVARWWLFPGDPWQIERDDAGLPVGIVSSVYADIDAALALAETYKVVCQFCLFSAPSALPVSWLDDSDHRRRLVDALRPLFARYASHPRLMTWEVVNEPDWDIWGGRASLAGTRSLVGEIVAAVTAAGQQHVTVGAAMLDGLPHWVGLGLTYYQAHWYDAMQPGDWCARCTDYATVKARYALDAPLIIGEFYAGPDVDALVRWRDWRAKGFAGAYAWSLLSEQTHDRLRVDLEASRAFVAEARNAGPRL